MVHSEICRYVPFAQCVIEQTSQITAVFLCWALLIWSYYVFVGRICVPMLRKDGNARGSVAQGVIYLVFFNLIWFMIIWSYVVVITTSPGLVSEVISHILIFNSLS